MTTGPPTGLAAVRRAQTSPPAATGEHCEFCGVPVDERHGHVADLAAHRLLCVCRPCYLLFGPRGAGGGRYRCVGETVRRVADLDLDEATWDELRIPVGLAFFFTQSGVDHPLAFYPSPAGATESQLDLSAWARITAANPTLAALEPDVEAALVRGVAGGFTCHVVPVDLCYRLVGLVRTRWVGLAGGREVWQAIDDFFADLDRRGASA